MSTADGLASGGGAHGNGGRAAARLLLTLAASVAMGVWILILCGLAMAWDPLDRRLGFHDRRHAERRATMPQLVPGSGGAYGIRPAPVTAPQADTPAAA